MVIHCRLEEEVKKMSPQGEEVMMLSDIREESECEDMSTKGDDEEDVQSTSEVINHIQSSLRERI